MIIMLHWFKPYIPAEKEMLPLDCFLAEKMTHESGLELQ